VWSNDKLRYRKLSSPAVVDGKVVVGDGFGFVHVLSPDNGALIGRLATDGSQVTSVVPARAATMIVQTEKGAVVAIRL
jgi:outer membrane protein assembly factor BamB